MPMVKVLNDSYKNLKICFVTLPKGKIDARNPSLIRFSLSKSNNGFNEPFKIPTGSIVDDIG